MTTFDSTTVDVPCPHCGHKTAEKIARLKGNPQLTCRACGTVYKVDARHLVEGLRKVDRELDALRKTIDRINKRP
jgi:uncharacterized Zn finger protein